MDQIGFLGVGNMGGTLAACVCTVAGGVNVLVSSRTMEKAAQFAATHNCEATTNETLAKQANVIFLGVKPQKVKQVLTSIAPVLAARKDRFVLVSMIAGMTTAQIAQMAGGDYPVLRIMPNTPALVGEGMIPYCGNAASTNDDTELLCELLKTAGKLAPLPEELIDAASALCGCGPAFIYILLEALSDAGVSCGLPRETATQYAAQMVLGTAKMVLKTGKHPAQLKDAVCSPAGSTIVGVLSLEEYGFRAAAEQAVIAAYARTQELGKA